MEKSLYALDKAENQYWYAHDVWAIRQHCIKTDMILQ